jgi:hypothetical protein
LTKTVKATLTELAQEHTEAAVKVLAEVMNDSQSPAAARIAAANSILDRGHGKPVGVDADADKGDAPTVNVNITTAKPVKDIRVTRSDG